MALKVPPCWKCDQIAASMRDDSEPCTQDELEAWLEDIHTRRHLGTEASL